MVPQWKKIIATLCITTSFPFLIYMYNYKTDINNYFTDQLYITRTPSIYFLNTNPSDNNLKLRTLCAIESASLHNPYSVIIFYTLSPLDSYSNVLKNFPNVQIQLTIAEEILNNTPLSEWYKKGEYKDGPYQISHLSDAMRLALLWKQGGIYMDTDIWSVKAVSNMSNSIARENNIHVNGAVMIFDKQHPFLYDCMLQYVKRYDKNQFIAQGPGLLTKVLTEKCGIKGLFIDEISEKIYRCLNVRLLPPKTFFPVPYTHWKFFFSPVRMLYLWRHAFTFHLWNKMSGKFKGKIGNKLFVEELARRNCPITHKLMIKKGEI